MYKITLDEFHAKLKDREYIDQDENGDPVTLTCPNGIVKEQGKPDIVWAYYNGRKYEWELTE